MLRWMLSALRQWRWFALAALLAGCVLNPQPDLPSTNDGAAPGAGGSSGAPTNLTAGGASAGGSPSIGGTGTSRAGASSGDAAGAASGGRDGIGAAGETSASGEGGASAEAGADFVLGSAGQR